MRWVTLSPHHAVYKVGCCMWSTGKGHQSTDDNTCWRSTCRRKIILSSKVGEKLQRGLYLFLEIFEFHFFNNILQLHRVLLSRQEALDPVEARPRTPCISSKYHTINDCIVLPSRSKYLFVHIKRTCSNKNQSRNKSAKCKKVKKLQYNNTVSTVQNLYAIIAVIKLNKPHVLPNSCVNTLS